MIELAPLFFSGFLAGIAAVITGAIWYHFSTQNKGVPKSVSGLLVALAFLICVWSLGVSHQNFFHNYSLAIAFIACAIWLTFAIVYWGRVTYLLLPLSIAGTFLAVPDTEHTVVLAGLLCSTIFFFWPLGPAHMSLISAALIAVVVSFVIFVDGQGRPASIIVAYGTLGILLFVPALKRFTKPKITALKRFYFFAILLHVLAISVVIGMARTTASLEKATITALGGCGISSIILILVCHRYYIDR